MTEPQKAICRALLKLCYEHGFSSFYPLAPIAEANGLRVEDLYDECEQKGILFDLGPYGQGLIEISRDGRSASVVQDTRDLLAHWSDFRG